MAQGWARDLEFELVRKDGSILPVLLNATAIQDIHGHYVMSRATLYDMTDRRRTEEEIRRWNVDLERRVTERTRQLEIANRELEAFSYSVSHDLRAPLRSIYGFSQFLMEDLAPRLDPQAKDHLWRIQRAVHRMTQLIDDLLTLSRISRSTIVPTDVNLSVLSREVAGDLQKGEPDRQVDLMVVPDLHVHADRNLMRIVMENLLGNAWKFTRSRSDARIEVGRTRLDDQDVYFVRDNGAGFDMAYADKLFVPFQRLHSVDEFEGTGIGLSIVQRIIQGHNGRVWAEGKINEGATIYFTLPAKELSYSP
jgi:light-regulated signal transduction histidine kinase (bacteriophytochrome)